jgi:pilus assembly protein Flp/PilA
MTQKLEQLKKRLTAEEGQALVEYALILGLIAVAAVAILSALGTDIQGLLSRVDVAMRSAV